MHILKNSIQLINKLMKFCEYSQLNIYKYWLSYIFLIFTSGIDLILLGLTGLITASLLNSSIDNLPKYIISLYIILVIFRIIFSLCSQLIYINKIFKLRVDISTKFIKNKLNSLEENENKNSSTILLSSYLNELIYSICIPLTTLLTELFLILITLIIVFVSFDFLSLLIIPIILMIIIPIIPIIKLNQKFGIRKTNIESRIFTHLECYINSKFEIISLRAVKDVEKNIVENISEWIKNIRKHYSYSIFPRIYIENIIFFLIIGIILLENNINYDKNKTILLLSIILLPLIRILPSFGRVVSSIQQIKYGLSHSKNLLVSINENSYKASYSVKKKLNSNPTLKNADKVFMKINGELIINNNKIKIKNLVVHHNELIQLIGKSGSGKTIFLKNIAGFNRTDSITTQLLNDFSTDDIIYLPDRCLIVEGDLKENILLGDIKLTDLSKLKEYIELVNLDFNDFNLEKKLNFNATNISTGQRQRIGIVRAALKKAKLIIIDEGISNLPISERINIIRNLLKLGTSIIIVDHSYDYRDIDNIKHWSINDIALLES